GLVPGLPPVVGGAGMNQTGDKESGAAVGRGRGALAAAAAGIRRVNHAPAPLLGGWVVDPAGGPPPPVGRGGLIAQQPRNSMAADMAADSVNYDWMQEFADQATGLGVTFKPTIIGFGAVLDNLSAFMDDMPRPAVIVGAASVYLLGWLFLAGGIIDRLARDRRTRAHRVFSACGGFFFPFLRPALAPLILFALP